VASRRRSTIPRRLRYFDLFHLVESSLVIASLDRLSLLIGVPAGYALARARTKWAIGIAISSSRPHGALVATLLPFYMA